MLRRLVLCVVAVALCGGCGSKSPTGPTPAADFASQFDVLWSTFDRQYSYFDYKHIDWNALREAYRPRALAAADQTGFLAVIREMLGQLHDLHVVIRDPSGATIQTYDPHAFTNWDRSVWDRYIARAGWTQGQIDWGHGVLDGVPYIVIGAWSPTAIRVGDFDAAFERYRNAPLIIVDVRMNSGGDDSIAYDIAGRFTSTSITAGFAKFRDGASHSSFGALMPRVVNPRGSWQYGGKVLLLIGQRCVSSNESFIAAMSRLPNVTLMGDRTGGASANPMSYPLANGWTYTVSRWIEYTADQQVIEDVGIAPRIAVPSTAADFAAGRDPVLDAALSMRPSS